MSLAFFASKSLEIRLKRLKLASFSLRICCCIVVRSLFLEHKESVTFKSLISSRASKEPQKSNEAGGSVLEVSTGKPNSREKLHPMTSFFSVSRSLP